MSDPQASFSTRLRRRFVGYSTVGGSSFALDLTVLYALVAIFDAPYALAAVVGFLIGITVNYTLNYRFVYRGTDRDAAAGFALFFLIALVGAGVVYASMMVLIGWLGLDALLARVLVAGIVGTVNFLVNTFFNFRLV